MNKHLSSSLSTNITTVRNTHTHTHTFPLKCHLKKSLQKLVKSTDFHPISWLFPIGVYSFVLNHQRVF